MFITTHQAKWTENGIVCQRAYLAIAADSTVTTASCFGKGITFTKITDGVYKGTLDASVTGLAPTGGQGMQVFTEMVKSAAGAFRAEVIDQDVANGYFQIRIVDASDAAVAVSAAIGVNILILHKDSGVA